MYKEIDNMISDARKSGEKSLLKVLQLIKAEFQHYLKSKNAGELDEVQEAKILMKLAENWKKEYNDLLSAKRNTYEIIEDISILTSFIPKSPSEEDIKEYTSGAVTAYKLTMPEGYKLSMKDMKPLIAIVQEKYPFAEGKVISKVLKNILK